MDKAMILSKIQSKHADMQSLLASLDERQMTQQGVYGELSVKDVLAHIVAWERMMLVWLATSLHGEKPVRFAPGYTFEESDTEETVTEVMDKLNDRIYRENKDRPLSEVMADFRAAHQEVVKAIQGVTESDLTDQNRFPWRNGQPFWPSVAGNTYGHYAEHIDLIRAWLDKGEGVGEGEQ